MKTKKIFTYLLVALLSLTLLLAGCSSSAPQGSEAETIKIGGNFELTGGVAEFGKKGENGAKLAIKEINEAGGVLGKQIEYVGADNKSEAGESTAATTKLATQDQVVGIAQVALLMATLPPHVEMLEAIVLPHRQQYVGRG